LTICPLLRQQAWCGIESFPEGQLSQPPNKSPDNKAQERDGLGQACFWLHIAILLYIVTGWLLRPTLIFYLVLLPAVVLHWRFNSNACILNNLENLIRSGRWRDPENREEGVWLQTLIRNATGASLSTGQTDLVTYGATAVLWGLGLWHLAGW
jgi:hypothetical protein